MYLSHVYMCGHIYQQLRTSDLTINETPVRERNSKRTKEKLLKAAQVAFSARGYAQASVREVAADAGCDPSLIKRYFGSKENLYQEALTAAVDVSPLMNVEKQMFGAAAADYFLQSRDLNEGADPLRMLILGAADPDAREISVKVLNDCVIGPLAEWFGGDFSQQLAAHITILCSGFFLYRNLLP